MSYDFSRFSPQSFERLVQAMAAATVGGRVQVFGTGKDGAREATFTGACRLAAEDWDGYVVFQAKHHGVPDTPANNAEWLIKQMDEELAKFEDAKRALKRPEYYVIASNVRLSAAAADASGKGMGGIDRVTKHLESWATRLKLRGVHLWHADTLSALLDAHKDVRSLFDFWVQPGDVLAGIMRHLAGPQQNEVLVKYLRHSLKASREIKTRDIGQAAGRTITLDDVFVDLPVSRHALTETLIEFDTTLSRSDVIEDDGSSFLPDEALQESGEFALHSLKVLAQLTRRAADSFHPQRWAEIGEEASRRDGCRRSDPLPNRVVLLGGPGQGKSTIGQFFAQLCRARLLKELPQGQAPETNRAIEAILEAANQQNVPSIGALRYPFQVELPRYANALSDSQAKDGHLSILTYLTNEIGRASDVTLKPTELENWLGKIPSCIILDGLDEVPHSGNRAAVIVAIEDLLDVLHHVDADSLIFATSRPQGYQEELSPEFWAHWRLTALELEDALNFAKRVAHVLVSDDDRRTEILTILGEAAKEEATASLMISPLQMMMLFHLVSTHNNIPRDRWTLFRRHYEMLCEREIAKSGQLGNMIREFRSQIDSIHFDAGYLLHLRAEGRGGANSFFTDWEFAALVREHLARDGYDEGQNLEGLTRAIAKLATDRLVFLRSAVEGNIAFDVRSLQEFMAAARLTSSPEGRIRDRLTEIAGRSHWSHVFKIACAKIYASTGHEALREPVIALLDSLDTGDRADDDRVLSTGSRLALELLQDGTATTVPLFRRKLVARAARLISILHGTSIWQLSRALDLQYRQVLEPVFRAALCRDATTRITMLRMLALLSREDNGRNHPWVDELLLAAWPKGARELFAVFDDLALLPERDPIAYRLRCAQWAADPALVISWTDELLRVTPDEWSPRPNILICSGEPGRRTVTLCGEAWSRSRFLFAYHGLADATSVGEPPTDALPIWHVLRAACEFATAPSIGAADAFLAAVEERDQLEPARKLGLPWVLSALLARVPAAEPLDARRRALQAGEHGDEAVWQAAERRWNERGVNQTEMVPPSEWQGVPIDIAAHGGPLTIGRRLHSGDESGEGPLLALVARYPGNSWAARNLMMHSARDTSTIGEHRRAFLLAESTVKALSESSAMTNYGLALVSALRLPPTDSDLLVRLCEILPSCRWLRPWGQEHLETLIRLFTENPDRRMLIPPLALNAISLLRTVRRRDRAILSDAMVTATDDPPEVRAGSAALRLLHAVGATYDKADIEHVVGSAGPFIFSLISALARDRGSDREQDALLLALSREVVTRRRDYVGGRAYQMLLDINETRRVSFSDSGVAAELDLPPALPLLGRSEEPIAV